MTNLQLPILRSPLRQPISSLRELRRGSNGIPVDPSVLMDTKFSLRGDQAVPNGFAADVGPAASYFGAEAEQNIISGGRLKQGAGVSGQNYVCFDLSETPGEIGCNFNYAGAGQPPVMSMFQPGLIPNLTSYQMSHAFVGINGLSPQFGDRELFGNAPADYPDRRPDWLGPVNDYVGGALSQGNYSVVFKQYMNWYYMELYSAYDKGGVLLARQQAYHSRLNQIIGKQIFFQLFGASIEYDRIWAKKVAAFNVPVLNTPLDTYFASGTVDGILASAYNALGDTAAPFKVPEIVDGKLRFWMNGSAAQGSGIMFPVTFVKDDYFDVVINGPDAQLVNTMLALVPDQGIVGPDTLTPYPLFTGQKQQYRARVVARAASTANGRLAIGDAAIDGVKRFVDLSHLAIFKNGTQIFVN